MIDWDNCLATVTDQNNTEFKIPTLDCFGVVLMRYLAFGLLIAGIITVIMVMIAAYKYMSSGGDAKQVGEAQQTLTYAIIGLVIVLLSFMFLNLIATITGLQCITSFGFANCG